MRIVFHLVICALVLASSSSVLRAETIFTDDFEAGLGNWSSLPAPPFGAAPGMLTSATDRNHTPGGAKSAYTFSSGDGMYRNTGSELGNQVGLSWYMYVDGDSVTYGTTQSLGTLHAFTGNGYAQGTQQQSLGIGTYSGFIGSDKTRFQGCLTQGTGTTWFNINEGDGAAALRTVGWHALGIVVDGATAKFYIDGFLGKTLNVASTTYDSVTLGFGAGGDIGDVWYDDMLVTQQVPEPGTIALLTSGLACAVGLVVRRSRRETN